MIIVNTLPDEIALADGTVAEPTKPPVDLKPRRKPYRGDSLLEHFEVADTPLYEEEYDPHDTQAATRTILDAASQARIERGADRTARVMVIVKRTVGWVLAQSSETRWPIQDANILLVVPGNDEKGRTVRYLDLGVIIAPR